MSHPPPPPVGYLVNHRDRLTGTQGIGYDYVLAGNGLWVQAQSPLLTTRIPAAAVTVRGLAPVPPQFRLHHGRLPTALFRRGLSWLAAAPTVERFFAITYAPDRYRLEIPSQQGLSGALRYTPPAAAIAEFHSHGPHQAFFSDTDDADEQGFRIYGVIGALTSAHPALALRLGVYGHYTPVPWDAVFDQALPAPLTAAPFPET